jgi:hypothetical protein
MYVATLVVIGGIVGASTVGAQNLTQAPPPAAGLTIQNVTLHDGDRVMTITGTGFGASPLVTLDGQAVATLPGATDTQVQVLAPVAVLTTPGTYRLTVMDPARQVGEAFVVATHSETESAVSLTTSGTSPAPSGTGVAVGQPRATSAAAPLPSAGLVGPLIVEDSGPPYTTALGYQAAVNTTGPENTASGYQALYSNTSGRRNTASGYQALYTNTGSDNTASGYQALYSNTTGGQNTASGYLALRWQQHGLRRHGQRLRGALCQHGLRQHGQRLPGACRQHLGQPKHRQRLDGAR